MTTQRESPSSSEGAPRLFRRIFIANRGEVAARIARACDALGVTPVFAVSEIDADAPYVRHRERVVIGPARASESYLEPVRIVQAAKQSACTALHPGWGFLSESPLLATLCETHGVTFIGPPAHVMARMGEKTSARRIARAAGLALIPGSVDVLETIDEAREIANDVGYPVLLKAARGGGGRGMRVASSPLELPRAFDEAQEEARSAFGDGRLYLEKLIEGGRHIEVQLLSDRYGNVVHLGERDCTVQRNHQKLLEESPAPTLLEHQRARLLVAAKDAARSIGYVSAGTMEFLLDDTGELRFMEMNTRLQVEHPVTEMRSGIDLVVEQIRIAAGNPLSFTQDQLRLRGHVIECRINAEDPSNDFRPSPGTITGWELPGSSAGNIRVDTHVEVGYDVPAFYDSLLCKVIAWGESRDEAADRLALALEHFVCEGVTTTQSLHLALLRSRAFREQRYDTRTLPM